MIQNSYKKYKNMYQTILNDSKSKLKVILDQIDIGIVVVDKKGKEIKYYGQYFEKIVEEMNSQ